MIALLTVVGSILIFASGDEDLGSLTDVFGTLEELDVPGEFSVDLEAGAQWAIYRGSSDSSDPFFDERSLECQVRDPDGDLVPARHRLRLLERHLERGALHHRIHLRRARDRQLQGRAAAAAAAAAGRSSGRRSWSGKKVEIGEIFGFLGRFAAGIAVLLLGLLIATAIALPVMLLRSKKIGEARRAGALRG